MHTSPTIAHVADPRKVKTQRFGIIALSALILLTVPSCTFLADIERPSGSRYSFAGLLGTDATEVSRPGSWKATGVNNSTAAGTAKSAAISTTALKVLTPAAEGVTTQALGLIK
jgi:hypothetical protein